MGKGKTLAARRRAAVRGGSKVSKKKTSAAKKKGKGSSSSKRTPTAVDVLQCVDELVDCFQYEEAVKCCEEALHRDPHNAAILETLGSLLLELGHADKAYESFTLAVEASPESGYSKYMYLGQLVEGEEAVGYFLKGIAIMERELKEMQEAAAKGAHSMAEVNITPQDLSSAWCSVAEMYLTDCCFDDTAEAKCGEYCQKAVDCCPSNPEAYQMMASYLLSKGNVKEARENLSKGLSLWLEQSSDDQPNCLPPPYSSRVNVAKMLIEVEEFEKAFLVLEGLLKEDDEVVQVWYLMGWMHYLAKDKDSSRFYLEQAKELYVKFACDDVELLRHMDELLQDLLLTVSSKGVEGEAEGEGDAIEVEEGDPNGDSEEDSNCSTDHNPLTESMDFS